MIDAPATDDGPRPPSSGIDLSRVDPRRWTETRRRVEVIRAWTAKQRHTRSECERAAASLDMTPKHFMRLVSAWKKHRDATRIDGLGFRRGERRPARTLSAATRAIVDAVVAATGEGTSAGEVDAEVRLRCRAAGAMPPSAGMLHNLLMRARQRGRARDARPGILVGPIHCVLPTIADDGSTSSVVTVVVAVQVPGARILSHRLVWNDRLGEAVRQVLNEVEIDRADAPVAVARSLAAAIAHDGSVGAPSAGITVAPGSEILAGALGSWLDGIPIRHRRRTRHASAPSAAAAIDGPLSRDDAGLAIRLAIEAHDLEGR